MIVSLDELRGVTAASFPGLQNYDHPVFPGKAWYMGFSCRAPGPPPSVFEAWEQQQQQEEEQEED